MKVNPSCILFYQVTFLLFNEVKIRDIKQIIPTIILEINYKQNNIDLDAINPTILFVAAS